MSDSTGDRTLGEKIGEGASADVYAWAPGQVLKLFKAGYSQRRSWWEARMTRAAFAAGAPAPEVFDEVTVEGRFGVVLQRLDGPTLRHLSFTGAITPEQTGAILASLAIIVHQTAPPPDILPLREREALWFRSSGDKIPEHIATGILTLIERLAPGDGLCHGDLHGGNVIMTADGPRLIDWGSTVRAHAGLDFAWTHFILTELSPDLGGDPKRLGSINATMQSEYARLNGIPLTALMAAVEAYSPIVYVHLLLGTLGSPGLRQRLLQRIEAAVTPLNRSGINA